MTDQNKYDSQYNQNKNTTNTQFTRNTTDTTGASTTNSQWVKPTATSTSNVKKPVQTNVGKKSQSTVKSGVKATKGTQNCSDSSCSTSTKNNPNKNW